MIKPAFTALEVAETPPFARSASSSDYQTVYLHGGFSYGGTRAGGGLAAGQLPNVARGANSSRAGRPQSNDASRRCSNPVEADAGAATPTSALCSTPSRRHRSPRPSCTPPRSREGEARDPRPGAPPPRVGWRSSTSRPTAGRRRSSATSSDGGAIVDPPKGRRCSSAMFSRRASCCGRGETLDKILYAAPTRRQNVADHVGRSVRE